MKTMNFKLLGLIAVLAFAGPLMADEAVVTTPPASTVPAPEIKPMTENEAIQAKYNLSPEQMKSLNDSQLPDSQQVKVAQLAKSSGKSIDEVLKMRLEQKMGWGKIAKTLGVHPGELGRATSELKRGKNERRDEKKDHKEDGKHAEKRDKSDRKLHADAKKDK